mmetsp:Transcript_79852/g.171144  ORF Transcript_79852/g.171144 Transcript_79852/m.171144 type:complete len:233 (+) Transcript_79852:55-753(+)
MEWRQQKQDLQDAGGAARSAVHGDNDATHAAPVFLSALGLMAASFVLIAVAVRLYLLCTRRRRNADRPQRHQKKAVTAVDVDLRFPVSRIEGQPTCVVCLSPIEADEPCRTTQCEHAFHADCLMQWWTHKPRKSLRCPICRTRQRRSFGDNGESKDEQTPKASDLEQSPHPEEVGEATVVQAAVGPRAWPEPTPHPLAVGGSPAAAAAATAVAEEERERPAEAAEGVSVTAV